MRRARVMNSGNLIFGPTGCHAPRRGHTACMLLLLLLLLLLLSASLTLVRPCISWYHGQDRLPARRVLMSCLCPYTGCQASTYIHARRKASHPTYIHHT
ncbi:hypothetical protein FN846DRAFT_453169 [Sphaerosporella brunnea]|uniref:Uncharacterized protein n=1 Tax=Sphaerosporella brunnea TaxID=1250544 RepID=A0A5J5F485_9PEZI|nr:hypothetical protein FN846DRAFT_453169 [Sphaerosporella brunnea]